MLTFWGKPKSESGGSRRAKRLLSQKSLQAESARPSFEKAKRSEVPMDRKGCPKGRGIFMKRNNKSSSPIDQTTSPDRSGLRCTPLYKGGLMCSPTNGVQMTQRSKRSPTNGVQTTQQSKRSPTNHVQTAQRSISQRGIALKQPSGRSRPLGMVFKRSGGPSRPLGTPMMKRKVRFFHFLLMKAMKKKLSFLKKYKLSKNLHFSPSATILRADFTFWEGMEITETMTNEEGIISFLAYFNEIDKHFDKILNEEGFSPYNEKLKKIAEGNFSITSFVRKHIYQLKNFGELRNFITHGIKSNGETFATPTLAAIEKVRIYAEKITKPAKVLELFRKKVFQAKTSDPLRNILPEMKKYGYTNIPIYDESGHFQGILSDARLLYWLSDLLINEDYINLGLTKVEHIPLEFGWKDYLFISKQMSIFEVNELFTQSKKSGERLSVLFITETGNPDEDIQGMISAGDANIIDEYLIV
ncbi:MAG: hypothetical protein DLD55_05150 [candidate division SR1 bacterium]|nr:MAG: hypothetical protein DLD55_05150 [candidate division SR1 bacterium]